MDRIRHFVSTLAPARSTAVRRGSRALTLAVAVALVPLAISIWSGSGSSSASSGGAESSAGALATVVPGTSANASFTSKTGVAAARAVVKAHLGKTTSFVAPGPPVKARSLKGKTIWYIPVSAEIPVLQVEAAGMQQAAAALGMTFRTCDGKTLPADESACITQAVSAGAAGIITDSIDPTTVTTAVADAESHKVPIVSAEDVGQSKRYLQFITLGDPATEKVAADWIIANSHGKASILSASVSGDQGTEAAEAQFNGELKTNCPSCSLASVSQSAAELTNVTSEVSAALLQHPNTTYGFSQFDFLEPLFAKGVQTAGKNLKIVSTNGFLADVEQIKSGGPQVADIGANRNYLGWQAVDRLVRMMLGKRAPVHQTVPIRVFDASDVNSLHLTQADSVSGIWYGPITYRRDFEKLWGVR